LGFTVPTSVQRIAVPVLLQGVDAFIKSQTGSGKTLTYLLPLVNLLLSQPSRIQVQAPSTHPSKHTHTHTLPPGPYPPPSPTTAPPTPPNTPTPTP
jgi:superfamily II DNA/RNA helicase